MPPGWRGTLAPLLVAIAVSPAAAGAATFVVNTTADGADTSPGNGVCLTSAGTCSLRAALQEANATAALDAIHFAIPGAGVRTIRPASPLPAAAQPVVIDGFTQPGSAPNTQPREGINAVLLVEVDLSAAGSLILDGGGSTVRGLIVNRGVNGVWLRGGAGHAVEGCFVGTDPTGLAARGNAVGLRLESPGSRVGGIDPEQRTLVSGNGTGILLPCPLNGSCHAGTSIVNTYVGSGTHLGVAVPNGTGIDGTNTAGLLIEYGVVSGNVGDGIVLKGRGPVHHSTIRATGVGSGTGGQLPVPLPNGGRGIRLEMFCTGPPCIDPVFVVDSCGITSNREGISIDGGHVTVTWSAISGNVRNGIEISSGAFTRGLVADNQISRNGEAGLFVDGGRLSAERNVLVENGVGTGRAGIVVAGAADAVVLRQNRLLDNAGLGIDLIGDGVTPNDPLDADAGPNGLQNFPVLTSACDGGGALSVRGTLASRPASDYAVDLFWSTDCDASAHGEAAVHVGALSVTTAPDGTASFSFLRPGFGAQGRFLTATASTAEGTSEIGGCLLVTAAVPPPAQTVAGPSSVCEGTPFVLRASGGGDSYQWFLNAAPIPGATGPSYGRPSAAPGDAGAYTVRASRCGADVTSPAHALSVVTCAALPVRLDVDVHAVAGSASDLNRVLEPGESVVVEPRYRNATASALTLSGTATLGGPPPGVYAIPDAGASYGAVAASQLTDCFGATGDCYRVTVAGPRPAAHWDATFAETTSTADPTRLWPLHVGETFTDVPRGNLFYRFVETLAHNGVTGGCTGTTYCPVDPTTREQMAVFVLVAKEGVGYRPPDCAPPPRFGDVPPSSPFCRWVEELARRNVVSGCGAGNYCPAFTVARDQMAVFVLATREAPGYQPPACVAGAERFADVPASSPFCRWVEELARRGVVAGCGGGNYCPTFPVTRGEMAVFIAGTFGLLLYGP